MLLGLGKQGLQCVGELTRITVQIVRNYKPLREITLPQRQHDDKRYL